jgi:HTH-type transcriptional regulator/antitoxin MqsA
MKTTIPTECPSCGSPKSVALHQGRFTTTYNKVPIALDDVQSLRCEVCGEEFFSKEQQRELSQRVKEAARKYLGGLSPERIIAIRKKLNLSQEDLEKLLGLGEKVVTRWETGRVVPGRTTDYLLRLLERKPELLEDLRAIRREFDGSDVLNDLP